MQYRWFVSALVVAGLIGFFAGSSFSDDPQPSEDEMMKMMEELGKPGPAQKLLAPMVGTWEGTAKYWMKPGEDPDVQPAKAVVTWVMGGRFIQTDFSGAVMGKKFKGRGIMGHDNFKKVYQSTWYDNWGSGVSFETGSASEDGKTFTMNGTWEGPMGKMDVKHVYRIVSDDEYVLESFMVMGEESTKNMEITFKRKKEAPARPVYRPRFRRSKGPGY